MLTIQRSFKRWSWTRRAFYRLAASIVPRAIRFLFHFEVHNLRCADMFPEGQPVIYCANHQSHLDGPIVASAILAPFGPRKFLLLMGSGKAIRENFLFRRTTLLGAFPVFPENPTPAFRYASLCLNEGFGVLITPQGRRINRTPYHDYFNLAQEGKTGVGRLILKQNGKVPVLPLYIHGASEALRIGSFKPQRKAHISVSFIEPIFFDKYTRDEGWSENDPEFFEVAREITDTIMRSIRNKLIEYEEFYIRFIEWKFDAKIDNIQISPDKEKQFIKFLRKLSTVHPDQIKSYLLLRT